MKKSLTTMVLCLILSVVLLCPALADDAFIREKMGAPEHMATTFTSSSGRLTFAIDADVEVPSVSIVNVYEVSHMPVPEENAAALADELMGPDTIGIREYAPNTLFDPLDGETSESLLLFIRDNSKLFHAEARYQYGIPRGQLQLCYDNATGLESYGDLPFASESLGSSPTLYGRRGTVAKGCAYSYEEALDLARAAAAIIAPDLTEVVCSIARGRYDETEGYEFCFYRLVDGIPVTFTLLQGTGDLYYNDSSLTFKIPQAYESLRMIVYGDLGLATVLYESPYQVGNRLETDVALLPFDQIIEIAQRLLPLSMAAREREIAGAQVKIDRIVFGYARVDMKDEPYRYKLVPVWDFIGGVEGQDPYYVFSQEDYSFLTIDATTGLTIDRNYGY